MKAVRYVEFTGSFGWLVFWVIVLFPVAVMYFLLKSCVVEHQVEDEALATFLRGRHEQPWYSRGWAVRNRSWS
jgi:hypothetical protein